MNSFASIAAALQAAATNASAGITSPVLSPSLKNSSSNNKKIMCIHHSHFNNNNINNNDLGNVSPIIINNQINNNKNLKNGLTLNTHQIGTNLNELTVCWHKMSSSDLCEKCGEPFYEANQFNCQKCSISNSIEQLNKKLGDDLNLNDKINPVNDLIINNELLNSSISDESTFDFNTIITNSTELTRNSFEQEFTSLIVKSNVSTSTLSSLFKEKVSLKLSDQIDIISSSSGSNISSFSTKDLIDQIKLYNKYNQCKLNEIRYNLNEENDSLNITGNLKIYWNLRNPLKICNTRSNNLDYHDNNNTNFTSLKDLNEKKLNQTSWDDSSLKNLPLNQKMFKESFSNSFSRSQTVKCRPTKNIQRAKILPKDNLFSDKNNNQEDDQKFIPSYGCVSSICIDNSTTCLNAIKILLDKFHISNPSEQYSLYKVYQSGDKKELKGDDFPLIQRLWMGPFSEDKIFIMEKGRQLNINQEIATLVCLPLPLLYNLIENVNQEEIKEENSIRQRYLNYSNVLNQRIMF